MTQIKLKNNQLHLISEDTVLLYIQNTIYNTYTFTHTKLN